MTEHKEITGDDVQSPDLDEGKVSDPLDHAYALWGEGDYGGAVDELNRYLAQRPYSTEAFEMKIDVLWHANLNLYFAGMVESRYLGKHGTYQGLSPANRRLGKWHGIEMEYDSMASDRRKTPDINYRAAIMSISGHAMAAEPTRIDIKGVAEMSRALGTPSAALLEGLVNERAGRYAEAAEGLEKAVTGSPPVHEAFPILSRVYHAIGRRPRAAALSHLSMMSGNHLWYTTGAVNFDTLEQVVRGYDEFNPLQPDGAGLRFSGMPRFMTALEDLPRTPVRLPLGFKRFVKLFLPIWLLRTIESVVERTPLGRLVRSRRYR